MLRDRNFDPEVPPHPFAEQYDRIDMLACGDPTYRRLLLIEEQLEQRMDLDGDVYRGIETAVRDLDLPPD